jgi:hypothetical protein
MAPSDVYENEIIGYAIRSDGCIEIISTGWFQFEQTPIAILEYSNRLLAAEAPPIEEPYIFNPYIQRHFIGPITRQLASRSRPSVINKRASRHDRIINKRKNWLKQLRS